MPLREMEISTDDEKRIRGFMFLSQKPILYVLNVNESQTLGDDLEKAIRQVWLERNLFAQKRRGNGHLWQSGSRTGGNERRRGPARHSSSRW